MVFKTLDLGDYSVLDKICSPFRVKVYFPLSGGNSEKTYFN